MANELATDLQSVVQLQLTVVSPSLLVSTLQTMAGANGQAPDLVLGDDGTGVILKQYFPTEFSSAMIII